MVSSMDAGSFIVSSIVSFVASSNNVSFVGSSNAGSFVSFYAESVWCPS